MSFIEKEDQSNIGECIDAYRKAIKISSHVKDIFHHRAEASKTMIQYANHVYTFMFESNLPRTPLPYKCIGNFTYDDLCMGIVEYANSGVSVDIGVWAWNSLSGRSLMLQTIDSIRGKASSTEIEMLLGTTLYKDIMHLQTNHNVPMLDKIRKLIVWYRDNFKRIEAGNPGTIVQSELSDVRSFIKSLTDRAISDYSVYHINSPQWFLWAGAVQAIHHVDIYTVESFSKNVPPSYEIKQITPLSVLGGVLK